MQFPLSLVSFFSGGFFFTVSFLKKISGFQSFLKKISGFHDKFLHLEILSSSSFRPVF